jgi:hypothetical protein
MKKKLIKTFVGILYIISMVVVFIRVDRNSHSVSDTLYGVSLYFIIFLTLMLLSFLVIERKAR